MHRRCEGMVDFLEGFLESVPPEAEFLRATFGSFSASGSVYLGAVYLNWLRCVSGLECFGYAPE